MLEKIILQYIEKNKNGYVIVNNDKLVVYANAVAKEFFGNDINQLLGNFLNCNYTLIEKKQCQETSNCNKCIVRGNIEKILKDKQRKLIKDLQFNSNSRLLNISCSLEFIYGYVVIEFIEISMNKKNEYLINKLLDSATDLLFYKDCDLRYKYVNNSYAKFLGRDKEDILEKTDADILPRELVEKCIYSDRMALEKNIYSGFEDFRGRRYRVLKEKIDGGVLSVAQDITEETSLYIEANTDELTQLGNRKKFNKYINDMYREIETERECYLALIDIDDFGYINNTLGHAEGDEYLRKLSFILSQYGEGVFFRLGGDEFIGVIHRDIKKVQGIFKSICRDIEKLELKKILTISVGIKKLDFKLSYRENYILLDEVLYLAKKKGKNQVCYY